MFTPQRAHSEIMLDPAHPPIPSVAARSLPRRRANACGRPPILSFPINFSVTPFLNPLAFNRCFPSKARAAEYFYTDAAEARFDFSEISRRGRVPKLHHRRRVRSMREIIIQEADRLAPRRASEDLHGCLSPSPRGSQ